MTFSRAMGLCPSPARVGTDGPSRERTKSQDAKCMDRSSTGRSGGLGGGRESTRRCMQCFLACTPWIAAGETHSQTQAPDVEQEIGYDEEHASSAQLVSALKSITGSSHQRSTSHRSYDLNGKNRSGFSAVSFSQPSMTAKGIAAASSTRPPSIATGAATSANGPSPSHRSQSVPAYSLSSFLSSSVLQSPRATPSQRSSGFTRSAELQSASSATSPFDTSAANANSSFSSGNSARRLHSSSMEQSHEQEKALDNSANRVAQFAPFVPLYMLRHVSHCALEGSDIGPSSESFTALVAFCDDSGFTKLTETLSHGRGAGPIQGAERARDAISHYFGCIIDSLTHAGGDVAKLAGDAVVVIWPLDANAASAFHDNHNKVPGKAGTTTQAEYVAHKLTQLTAELDCYPVEHSNLYLQLHSALTYGDMTVYYVGGDKKAWLQTPAGEALNQVQSALDQANPGTVVCSPEAWSLMDNSCIQGIELDKGCVEIIAANQSTEGSQNGDLKSTSNEAKDSRTSFGAAMHMEYRQRALERSGNSTAQARRLMLQQEVALRSLVPAPVAMSIRAGTDSPAELRRVTIAFCHIEPSEHLQSHQTTDSVKELQSLAVTMQEEVHSRGGLVKELTVYDKGMVMVAAFGAPAFKGTLQEAAVQAVRMGLAVRRLASQQCSVGIATGDIFCGAVGNERRSEYSLIGPSVVLAARLMSSARKFMGILTEMSTASLARSSSLSFSAKRPVHVKGRSEPVSVFRPRDVTSAVRPSAYNDTRSSLSSASHEDEDADINVNVQGFGSSNASSEEQRKEGAKEVHADVSEKNGNLLEHNYLRYAHDASSGAEQEYSAREINRRSGHSSYNKSESTKKIAHEGQYTGRDRHTRSAEDLRNTELAFKAYAFTPNRRERLNRPEVDHIVHKTLHVFQRRRKRACCRRGKHPEIVLIEGFSGSGKTVSLDLLRDEATRLNFAVAGASFSIGEVQSTAPERPWFNLLSTLEEEMLIAEGSLSEALDQRRQILEAIGSAISHAAALPSHLRYSLRSRNNAIASELARVLTAMAQTLVKRRPLLMVLDGCDGLTGPGWEILLTLTRSMPSSCCICVATRPAVLGSTLAGRISQVRTNAQQKGTCVLLHGMSERKIIELIQKTFSKYGGRKVDSFVTDFIVERSQGNPSIATVLSRSALASGGIHVNKDGMVVATSFESLAASPVPSDIRSTLLQQRDLLPSSMLEIMRVASVTGQVSTEIVLRLSPSLESTIGTDELEAACAHLFSTGFLESADTNSPLGVTLREALGVRNSNSLRYTSCLLQDVIRSSWGMSQRSSVHKSVAHAAQQLAEANGPIEEGTQPIDLEETLMDWTGSCGHKGCFIRLASCRALSILHLLDADLEREARQEMSVAESEGIRVADILALCLSEVRHRYGEERFAARPREWLESHVSLVPEIRAVLVVQDVAGQKPSSKIPRQSSAPV